MPATRIAGRSFQYEFLATYPAGHPAAFFGVSVQKATTTGQPVVSKAIPGVRLAVWIAGACATLRAVGQGGTSPGPLPRPPPTVSVSVTPAGNAVLEKTLQLTASVTGASA